MPSFSVSLGPLTGDELPPPLDVLEPAAEVLDPAPLVDDPAPDPPPLLELLPQALTRPARARLMTPTATARLHRR
jgi:hypothetical protein